MPWTGTRYIITHSMVTTFAAKPDTQGRVTEDSGNVEKEAIIVNFSDS